MAILALLAGAFAYAMLPGSSTFTVSTETTYVTGPLDKSGYVDYVTALNERLSKGITPENNANVLIWQALGPRPTGDTAMPAEYFQWLGIEPPPEQGEYLVDWRDYLKEHAKSDTEVETYVERMSQATQWPWTAKKEPELAEWLKRNEKPLAVMMDATRHPQYYNPLVPERTDDWSPGLLASLLPNVQQCRKAASALACRAMLRVSEGRIDEAWQDLLACHRLGRLVARGGTLLELLVGIAIDRVASRADVAFLGHAKLTSKQVLACLEDLRKLPPMPAVADKMDLTDRFTLLEIITLTARQGKQFLEAMPRPNDRHRKGNQFVARLFTRSINWDPALRNTNHWFDRFTAALRIADRAARVQELAAIRRDLTLLKRQVTAIGFIEKSLMGPERRGEMSGNVIIVFLLPAFDKVQSAEDRFEQEQRNLHLAFLLAAYRQDHGRYPERLAELAPKYLVNVSGDLFSGKPLIYRREGEGYLLYSVGRDGIDDEGRGYDDEPQGDDLSVRMPLPEPRRKE
ncbi:MAG TPA: hypothetical protein VGY66_29445 [Gemmataceae bacterium]|nr:hypothetical protein [Gemmataceae bacterium]